jgi:cation diffusion facilitator CzcD-associated flavoprotein CzcO
MVCGFYGRRGPSVSDRSRLRIGFAQVTSVAIVGAGFGGVGAAALLTRAGFPDVTVFEKSERIGGVWQANRYPGAACDVPSHLYEFSFAPNPDWSRRYAPQAEIEAYIEDVARAEGVIDRIHTGVEVRTARWDEQRRKWDVRTTARGEDGGPIEGGGEFDLLITACGQLSVPKPPDIPGRDRFDGPAFHTAQWRPDVSISGRRIAVIGTGASAIQVVPAIAPYAAHVDVYQRTPGWTLPRGDYPYPPSARRLFRRFPWVQRLDRETNFRVIDLLGLALTSQPWMRRPLQAIANSQIRRAVKDPELVAKVTPNFQIGCKRIMFSDNWYSTLVRDNVTLVTDAIAEITPTGVRTGDGVERLADVIVYATGFDSHAFVSPMEITGVGGRTLSEAWDGLPRAYLGVTVPGFPNMFMVYGPNTNSGAGSVIFTIESGMQHVVAALREMAVRGAASVEVTDAAAARFDAELRAALSRTVYHSGCTNWYLDANGNDPSQWPWIWSTYRRRTATLIPGDYQIV